ncbi:MAG: hypothetical protein V3T08_06585 [Gemmatimonadota bacterium]
MKLPHLTASMLAAVVLLALPATASAQKQKCEGLKPKGGKWVASGELYLDRARKNARPEEKRKLYRQAVDILSEGFDRQTENPKNFMLAGQAFVGLGDLQAAHEVWLKAEEMWSCYLAKIDTLRFRAWVMAFNRAVRSSNSGDAEKAFQEYQDAYTIYPKQPQPLIQIAGYYANKAQVAETSEEHAELSQQAIDFYRRALKAIDVTERLGPEDKARYSQAATFNLAQLLAFEERYEEASQAYHAFLESEPDHVDARSNAAVVLTLAADQLEEEAESTDDGPQEQELVARAEQLNSAANEHYARLLARDDLEADDYQNIGAGLTRSGKDAEATVAFGKALQLEPYRTNSLESLAMGLYGLQNWDSLAVVARTLVERYPLNLNNLALLANAYRELEQSEKALEVLERREALALEVLSLETLADEGSFSLSGVLHNYKLDPGVAVELQFDFYDDTGELVATTRVTVDTPPQGAEASFEVVADAEVAPSGFSYRLADSAQASGG